MKRKNKRWLGLTIAPALLALIGFASPAQAANYSGNCDDIATQFDGIGNVNITDGACTLTQDLTATGDISIEAASITGNAIHADGKLTLKATSGNINITSPNPDALSANGDISIEANSVKVPSLKSATGRLNVKANNGEITVTSTAPHSISAHGDILFEGKAITAPNFESANGRLDVKANDGEITVTNTSPHSIVAHDDILFEGKAITAPNFESANGRLDVKANDGEITVTGTAPHSISAHGELLFEGKAITAPNFDAGSNMSLEAKNGKIKVDGEINSNLGGESGNILITATESVATGKISTNGGEKSGGVEINAFTGGAGTEFVIGGDGSETNGVNGPIVTGSTTGGGTLNNFITGGIFITNGNTGSTAGIRLKTMSDIQVRASSSRSGIIQLNARGGKIKLPAGELNTDGIGASGAGVIILAADVVQAPDGAVLTAKQSDTAAPTFHTVMISARRIEFGGTGLTIQADGNGLFSSTLGNSSVSLFPKGGLAFSSNANYHTLTWTILPTNNKLEIKDTLNIAGTGTAPLKITANGDNLEAAVSGYPLKFSGGPVTIESKGAINHSVFVGYQGSTSNALGVEFAGSGPVNIDTRGVGGAGGRITLRGDKINLDAPSFTFNANGPDSGNGDSGSIDIVSTNLNLKNTSTAAATANAALTGVGNSATLNLTATIRIQSGTAAMKFGTKGQPDRWLLEARGGQISGNGGTVIVPAFNGSIQVKNKNAIDVSAPTSGNGGQIFLQTGGALAFVGANASLVANGGTTQGDGGTIIISGSNDIAIGPTGDAVEFHANARGSQGKGGTVALSAFNAVTLDGAGISVIAKGDADGGTIRIEGVSTIDFTGQLKAKGAGSGKGGTINLQPNTPMELVRAQGSTEVRVDATGGNDKGPGGRFDGAISVMNGALDNIDVQADKGIQPGGQGGIININGFLCEEKIVQTTWPQTYWNCSSQSGTQLVPFDAMNTLSSTVKTRLRTSDTALFVFPNASTYEGFSRRPAGNNDLGETFSTFGISAPTIHVNVIKQGTVYGTPNTALTTIQLKEVTVHELGHANDFALNLPSIPTTFFNLAISDFLHLDYISFDLTDENSVLNVRRDACGSTQAPFEGVVDDRNGNLICINGVLRSDFFTNGIPWSNSKIAQTVSPAPFVLVLNPAQTFSYSELYAQAFAYHHYLFGAPPADYFRKTADQLFKNNQFACTRGFVNQTVLGAGTGAPSYCFDINTWYVAGR